MEEARSQDFGDSPDYATGEESFELDTVLGLFTRLAIACKSRSLYPADHPAAQESAQMLFSIIEEALMEIPLIEIQAISDTLIFKDHQVGKNRESLRQLATRIRSLNIQGLSLAAGITKREVELLVDLLVYDPIDLEIEGGAENYCMLKGLQHVSVVESSAQLASQDAPGEGQDFRGMIATAEVDETGTRERQILANDVESFLNILFDPQELAELLMRLTEEDGAFLADKDLAAAIYEFLKDRSAVVMRAYPDLAEKCMRSLAEALLFLRTDLRNQLLLQKLMTEADPEPFGRDVLHQFSPQEISDILCHFFPLAPQLVPATRTILSHAGFEERELNKAIDLLRYRLLDLGEVSPTLIATLKTAELQEADLRGLPSLDEISSSCARYGIEEMEAIEKVSLMDLHHESLVATTPMLLDLLNKGLRMDNLGRVVALLKEHFWEFMAIGDLAYVATILERMRPLLNNPDPALDPYRSELTKMIEQAGSPKTIRDTVKMACARRPEEASATEDLKSYIAQLQEKGIEGLIAALGTEEDMTLRKYIIDILAEFAQEFLHILGRYMDDPRWYLVRNMVTIMAGVHSQETLPYLRITFTYDNPKVRAETVRALGLTGGYEASMLLITGLEDPDENIRLLCTRWLGRLGEEKAVGRLVRMLEGRDPGGESLVIKKELISSLGQIKAPESYQALKRFSSRQKLTRRSEWREINQAAGEALSRLVEKYPHLEGL